MQIIQFYEKLENRDFQTKERQFVINFDNNQIQIVVDSISKVINKESKKLKRQPIPKKFSRFIYDNFEDDILERGYVHSPITYTPIIDNYLKYELTSSLFSHNINELPQILRENKGTSIKSFIPKVLENPMNYYAFLVIEKLIARVILQVHFKEDIFFFTYQNKSGVNFPFIKNCNLEIIRILHNGLIQNNFIKSTYENFVLFFIYSSNLTWIGQSNELAYFIKLFFENFETHDYYQPKMSREFIRRIRLGKIIDINGENFNPESIKTQIKSFQEEEPILPKTCKILDEIFKKLKFK